jgi:hypothetical protein
MTRNTEHDARAQLEQRAQAARDNGVGSDWLRDIDDLAPARPNVWLVCAFIAVIAVIVMVLPGCGGGIDTADELMGPPETARVDPPRPCPVSVPECHSKPLPG